jgi:hypothetical protein
MPAFSSSLSFMDESINNPPATFDKFIVSFVTRLMEQLVD